MDWTSQANDAVNKFLLFTEYFHHVMLYLEFGISAYSRFQRLLIDAH